MRWGKLREDKIWREKNLRIVFAFDKFDMLIRYPGDFQVGSNYGRLELREAGVRWTNLWLQLVKDGVWSSMRSSCRVWIQSEKAKTKTEPWAGLTFRGLGRREESSNGNWERTASEVGGKLRDCCVLEAKWEKHFKKVGVTSWAKCCSEVESDEDWELAILYSRIEVPRDLEKSNYSQHVVETKAWLELVKEGKPSEKVEAVSIENSVRIEHGSHHNGNFIIMIFCHPFRILLIQKSWIWVLLKFRMRGKMQPHDILSLIHVQVKAVTSS